MPARGTPREWGENTRSLPRIAQILSGCTGTIQVTTNDLDFVWTESLQTARVAGTFTTAVGDTISLDVTWDGTGPIAIDQNNTSFAGRSSTFVGKERDATATGTVSLNGKTLVDGSTSSASIEKPPRPPR